MRLCNLHWSVRRGSLLAGLVWAVACTNTSSIEPEAVPEGFVANEGGVVLVATTDFTTGSYSVIGLKSQSVIRNIDTVSSDPVAVFAAGVPYIVNRFLADNYERLNPTSFKSVLQVSTGVGSNPHDLAAVSRTKAHISRYGSAAVQVVNPRTGSVESTISLAGFVDAGDPDGLPEMDRMIIVGDTLFVALQMLDFVTTFSPVADALLVTIDTPTDAATGAVPLACRQPNTTLHYLGATNRIYVGCVDTFGGPTAKGGIEAINPTGLSTDGIIVTEAALGGDIAGLAILDATKGYATVSNFDFSGSRLVSFNPSTGAIIDGALLTVGPFDLVEIVLSPDGSALYVTDRTFASPGVRIFDTSTDTEIGASPVDVGLPPISLAVAGP